MLRKRNIDRRDGNYLENGEYIPAVRGILHVELNKRADLLIVSVARGRFDFGLTLKS